MAACRTLGMHQALTSDPNPQGHADTERILRPVKADCLWLPDWSSPFAWVRALGTWIDTDHHHDRHAALGDRTPRKAAMEYHNRPSTPLVAA